MRSSRAHRSSRSTVEQVLLAVAVVSLSWYGLSFVEARMYQFREGQAFDQRLRENGAQPEPVAVKSGLVLGRLEIPRVRLSAVVREGDDERTLRVAVGHLPGTTLPGGRGNAAMAGHRDTFFRRLRDVERGDEVFVTTSSGVYRYRVTSTRIVEPNDVSVLEQTKEPVLTLVTCYPFSYVGPAPDRFIVRATLVARESSPFPSPR